MTYRTRQPRGRWHRHPGWHRRGGWHRFGGGCGRREDLISALERYQRDLEQRAADVAERIRHLRAQASNETESAEGADATPTTPTTHNV